MRKVFLVFCIYIIPCISFGYEHTKTQKPVMAHPLKKYKNALVWHQVWFRGEDWKWTVADCCPSCCSQTLPKPKCIREIDCYICPKCWAIFTEKEWDDYNIERYYWISWPQTDSPEEQKP
jgi:hypothetical protein